MIETPLGKIEIWIDDKQISYSECKLDNISLCPDLLGRYKVEVAFEPDGKEHIISCKIKDYQGTKEDSPESGERLECKAFYKNDCKVSLGMEGDSGYIGGKRVSDFGYDYDCNYLSNGVEYNILPETKTQSYVFGIAWIGNLNEERDVQTWFGADPTIM